jgi:hypothetical protein
VGRGRGCCRHSLESLRHWQGAQRRPTISLHAWLSGRSGIPGCAARAQVRAEAWGGLGPADDGAHVVRRGGVPLACPCGCEGCVTGNLNQVGSRRTGRLRMLLSLQGWRRARRQGHRVTRARSTRHMTLGFRGFKTHPKKENKKQKQNSWEGQLIGANCTGSSLLGQRPRERTRPLVLHHFQTGRGARPRGPPCSPPPHLRARRQARRVPRTIPRVHFFFFSLGGVAKRRKIHRGTSWSQSSKAYAILAVVRCAFQNFVLGINAFRIAVVFANFLVYTGRHKSHTRWLGCHACSADEAGDL